MNKKKKILCVSVFVLLVIALFWYSLKLETDWSKRVSMFLSLLGGLISVIGLFLAFIFIDRFDTAKKITERRFEATISLAEYLAEWQMNIVFQDPPTFINFVPKTERINRIKEVRWLELVDSPVYFESPGTFDKLIDFQKRVENIWLPKEIKSNCIFLMPYALISSKSEDGCRVSIGGNLGKKSAPTLESDWAILNEATTFSEFIENFEKLIQSIHSWLENNSGLQQHVDL